MRSQVPWVIFVNAHLGEAATPEARDAILKVAKDGGIERDPALALINFFDMRRRWPAFQKEFAARFGPLCDANALSALEMQERQAMDECWPLLCHMALRPSVRLARPRKDATGEMRNCRAELERSLEHRFRQMSASDVTISVMPRDVGVDGEPALWVECDTTSPITIFRIRMQLVDAMHRVFYSDNASLKFHVLRERWGNIYVLHLVEGRALCRECWRFDVNALTFQSPASDSYEWFPVRLPDDVWGQLKIDEWREVSVAQANELMAGVWGLWSVVASLCDTMAIPGIDEIGEGLVQQHLDAYVGDLGAALNSIGVCLRNMGERITALDETQRLRHKYLQEAIQYLITVEERVRPNEASTGTFHLSHSDLVAWEKRLEEAKEAAAVARILWIADAIKEFSASMGKTGRGRPPGKKKR